MAKMGPKWPIRGPNLILGGFLGEKVVQNGSQNGPKIDQKNNQNKTEDQKKQDELERKKSTMSYTSKEEMERLETVSI